MNRGVFQTNHSTSSSLPSSAVRPGWYCLWLLAGLFISCAPLRIEDTRPAHWAVPLSVRGCPNLHRVSKDLFRSAQPTAEGMRNLQDLGIRTVVNLRAFHSDRDEIGQLDLNHEEIPLTGWQVDHEAAVKFLRIVTDPERTPVLLHCTYGSDRTGALCAIYRVVVQGWTTEEAIKEMTEGGFGYHPVMAHLLRSVRELDAVALRKELGLPSGSP